MSHTHTHTLSDHTSHHTQVLEWSGGVLDALSMAVWAAISTTLIPKLTVTGEGEELEIEVSDNPHDSTKIDVSKAPIIVTLTQVYRLASCKNWAMFRIMG